MVIEITPLPIRIIFQGEVTQNLTAKWADTGASSLREVRLPATTSEWMTRILVSNPNAAALVINDVDVTTINNALQDARLTSGPVAIPPNSVDVAVAVTFVFNPVTPLEEMNGTVVLKVGTL